MTLFNRNFLLVLPLAALLSVLPVPGAAQVEMFAPDRIGNWYLGGGLGVLHEEDNPAIADVDSEFGAVFGGGYRVNPYFAVEIDGLITHQEFDTPPSAGGGRRSDLFTNGVGGVAKLILPLGRVELYLGGGIGLYTSRVEIDGPFLEDEEDDTDIGYQVMLGADVFVSRRISVGLEYRRFELEAEFNDLLPGGKIDTGGDLLFVTVRGHF